MSIHYVGEQPIFQFHPSEFIEELKFKEAEKIENIIDEVIANTQIEKIIEEISEEKITEKKPIVEPKKIRNKKEKIIKEEKTKEIK